MEETIKTAKRSKVALIFKLCLDVFACVILVGFIWFLKDLITYFTTKLELTNKKVRGKTGLINTNELECPLNKINGIQVIQGLFGKIFNYGSIKITTSSSFLIFKYIENPNEFKTILINQIDAYEKESK